MARSMANAKRCECPLLLASATTPRFVKVKLESAFLSAVQHSRLEIQAIGSVLAIANSASQHITSNLWSSGQISEEARSRSNMVVGRELKRALLATSLLQADAKRC